MGHARLIAGGVELVQDPLEGLVLLLGGLLAAEGAVEVGEDPGDGQILHILVDGDDLVHVLRQKAVSSHSRIHADVDLRHGGALGGDPVDGDGGLIGAHGEDDAQIQQLVDLCRIRRGAQHQDRRIRPGLPQDLGLLDLRDGKPVDAVLPQNFGKGQNADAVSVALEHRPDGHGAGKAADRLDILNERFPLDHICFHGGSLPCLFYRSLGRRRAPHLPRFLIR